MSSDILMRYKFLELLARIAKCKYIETQKEETVAASMERLISEVLLEHFTWEDWQEFRNKQLYTVEIADVFRNNSEGIQEVMAYYYGPKR